jgi:hypothetical protein
VDGHTGEVIVSAPRISVCRAVGELTPSHQAFQIIHMFASCRVRLHVLCPVVRAPVVNLSTARITPIVAFRSAERLGKRVVHRPRFSPVELYAEPLRGAENELWC